jgi:dihydroorotase
MKFDYIIKNAEVVFTTGISKEDIGIKDGIIADIGNLDSSLAENIVDATGLHLLSGVIDSQVHFREPGLEYKEDIESGTRSAVMGGVTAIMEMPNTKPATINKEAIAHKVGIANKNAWCDFAFFAGGHISDHRVDWKELEQQTGCCGIKIFMGSSTGNLLVDSDEAIEEIMINSNRRIALHCEDEYRLKDRKKHIVKGDVGSHPIWRDEKTALLATTRALNLAKKTNRSVHLLHITTKQEPEIIAKFKRWATMEVTPQHLTLDSSYYKKIGSLAQMNPPIRSKEHVDALWKAINKGLVDVIGSDHAPHTLEEKAQEYPNSPSGMPGVQTMLPIMLKHVNDGKLSLSRMSELLSSSVARVYNIRAKGRIALGYDADFAFVDMKKKYTISNYDMEYKCKWTPFDGIKSQGKVISTMVRGQFVMRDNKLQEKNSSPLCFFDVS